MERGGKQELDTCVADESCQPDSLQEISVANPFKGEGCLRLVMPSSNSTCSLQYPSSIGVRLMNWASRGPSHRVEGRR